MRRWIQVHLLRFISKSCLSHMLPSQDEKDDEIIKLNLEVEALKARCGGQEKRIKDLESRCDMYENALEMLQQQVAQLLDSQGTLSTRHSEKEYKLLP